MRTPGARNPFGEVHCFVNELERPIGTYLYGRRMYETMVYWEAALSFARQPPFVQDFAAIWQRPGTSRCPATSA